MSRKSRRAGVSSGVSDVTDALAAAGEAVADTVAKSGRRARKRAAKLAARAADSLPESLKPAKRRHGKRRVAVIVIVLAGVGVAAKKFMGAKSGGNDATGSRTPDE